MPVSHVMLQYKQILPAPTWCEDSSQTRQLERALPTGSRPCATILPVSLLTRNNAIQTIDIETSTGSVDVTMQSASSVDNTTTPENGATTEIQKHPSEYEAQQKLQGAIIFLYSDGPYNHQTPAIIRWRLLHANCESMQALENEKSLAISDSTKAAAPELGALVSAASSTDASVSPIRADAGSLAEGPIAHDGNFNSSASNFPPLGDVWHEALARSYSS